MLPRGSEEGWRKEGQRRKEEIGVYPPIFPPPPPRGFPHSCICRGFPGSLSLPPSATLHIISEKGGPNWTFPDSHRRRLAPLFSYMWLPTGKGRQSERYFEKSCSKRRRRREGESGFSFEKADFFQRHLFKNHPCMFRPSQNSCTVCTVTKITGEKKASSSRYFVPIPTRRIFPSFDHPSSSSFTLLLEPPFCLTNKKVFSSPLSRQHQEKKGRRGLFKKETRIDFLMFILDQNINRLFGPAQKK